MEANFSLIKHGSEEWKEAVALRENILRKPLGSFFSEEELEEEKDHFQIIGKIDNLLIATAVLVPESKNLKMQRVVVLDHLRGQNIGSKMMLFCESFAQEKGFELMYCHARDSAVQFYSKNQYSPIGDYFDEDGIPHLKMQKSML